MLTTNKLNYLYTQIICYYTYLYSKLNMKVDILCISDSNKHFSSACEEYLKRLGKSCTIHNIKPHKHGTAVQIIQKETELLIEKLSHKKYSDAQIILLEKDWSQLSSEKFALATKPWSHCLFIMWGPYGVDMNLIRSHVQQVISFGKQTMPHGLAKLVLLEQVYRSTMIAWNRSYHY